MKKSKPKAKAKSAPDKIKYAGHWVEGNIWFKIGLSKTEAGMLKAILRHSFNTKVTSAQAARRLLQTALAHYDVILPLMKNDEDYSFNEGFSLADLFLKGVITQQQVKITVQ